VSAADISEVTRRSLALAEELFSLTLECIGEVQFQQQAFVREFFAIADT
jgi:hypothetical protein